MATTDIMIQAGSRGANKVASDARKIESSWTQTGANLTIMFSAVTRAARVLFDAMAEPIAAAVDFTKQSAQLNASIGQVTSNVAQVRGQFDAYARTMQITYGVSLDAVTALQRMWVQMTQNTEHANKATTAAQAMSAALGIDVNTAMRGLSQTISGQTSMLSRYVPQLRDLTVEQLKSGKAMDLMIKKFGPALQANIDTVAGQYQRLSEIVMDRYLEQVALILVDNDSLKLSLKELGNALINLEPSFEGSKSVMDSIVKGTVGFVGGISKFVFGLSETVRIVTQQLKSLLDTALAPILFAFDKLVSVTGVLGEALGISPGVINDLQAIQLLFKDLVAAPLGIAEGIASGATSVSEFAVTVAGVMDRLDRSLDHYHKKQEKKYDKFKNTQLAGTEEITQKRQSSFAAYMSNLAALHAKEAELAVQHAKIADQRAKESMQMYQTMAMGISRGIGQTFGALVAGQMSAKEAILSGLDTVSSAVITSVINMVQAYSISAAGAAAFSQAGIPVIGPILAVAAAATMGAFVKSLLGGLTAKASKKFSGGIITGGVPHRDSVLTMTKQDEEVLTPSKRRSVAAALDRTMQGNSGSNISINLMGQTSRAETRRWLQQVVVPELKLIKAI